MVARTAVLFFACTLTTVLLTEASLYQEQQRANTTTVLDCFNDINATGNAKLCRGFISGVTIGGVLVLLGVVCICVCVGVYVYKCSNDQLNHRTLSQTQSSRRQFSGSSSSNEGSLKSQASNDDTTPLLSRASTNVRVKKRWTFFGHASRADDGPSDNELASSPPYLNTRVPSLVVHCVKEIERKGLTSEGLYRKSGSLRAVREVKESLLRADGEPALDNVDVNVLCGVLKVYLLNLREPIVTFALREAFIQATVSDSDEDFHSVIARLPPANKDTLAFLILHLQRVASHSDTNKMDKSNLARVLGPTIVGHGEPNPEPLSIQKDIPLQIKVTRRLLEIPGDYWWQFTSLASESLLSQ